MLFFNYFSLVCCRFHDHTSKVFIRSVSIEFHNVFKPVQTVSLCVLLCNCCLIMLFHLLSSVRFFFVIVISYFWIETMYGSGMRIITCLCWSFWVWIVYVLEFLLWRSAPILMNYCQISAIFSVWLVRNYSTRKLIDSN